MLHREWFTLAQTLLLIDDLVANKGWIEWKRSYPRSLILLTKLDQKDIIFSKANRGFLDSGEYQKRINDYFCIVSTTSSSMFANMKAPTGWLNVEAELRKQHVWSNVTETTRVRHAKR
jgi:hypothetical protein